MQRALVVAFLVVGSAFAIALLGATPAAAQAPSVAIVYPFDGAVVSTVGTRLQVRVSDFVLDPNAVPCVLADHGRIRVYLNDVAVKDTTDENTTLSDLPLLLTKIGVQLVCTDGSSLSPQVWHNITVRAADPVIALRTPASPHVVSTLGARLEYRVSNFNLAPGWIGGPHLPGEGHVHVFVGGALVGLSGTASADIASFPEGPFSLKIELHNNDHSLARTTSRPDGFNDTVLATGVRPSIGIASPSDGASVSAGGFRTEVAIAGFALDQENYAGVNVPGRGHVHYSVDGLLRGAVASNWFDFGPVAAGDHTIRAELRNNDHSALSPAVFQEIVVTAAEPSIRIVTPANNSAASTAGARVVVDVAGFQIDAENYAGTNIPGRGHIHYSLNGTLAGAVASTVFEFDSLPAGTHTIRAELRNNDHSALIPAVFDEVNLTVSGPSIAIAQPTGPVVSTLGARIVVSVAGLALSEENYAGPNVAGQGHVHYYVDGVLAGAVASTTFDVPGFTAGTHTIRAELRNNDHSALIPAVFDVVTVTAVAPAIAIVSPADGAGLSNRGFRIAVSVAGLEIDGENYGAVNVPGHGHVHFYVDGALAGAVASTTFDIGALGAGAHTIRAELVHNDHSPLSPAVDDEITVTVAAPSIAILTPASGATSVSTLGFRVEVAVSGFVLDEANAGGVNVPGQGHIHYLLDGALAGMTASTTFDFGPVSAGARTVRAELRNNDHTPLSPTVSAQITVTAGAPSLTIEEPSGATASTGTLAPFRIRVSVANFALDPDAVGGSPVAGRGHIHYFLDGATVGVGTATWFDYGTLAAGARTVRAELHNNDHTPLSPRVFDEVAVTAIAPSIQVSLSSSSIVAGTPLYVNWTVAGFILDPNAIGGAAQPGRGHVHVFVDGTYLTANAGNGAVILGLSVGSHTIKVQLFNNDHSALATEYSATAAVEVTAPAPPPATVDASIFLGSLIVLIIVIAVLAVLLTRKGRVRPPAAPDIEEKGEEEP